MPGPEVLAARVSAVVLVAGVILALVGGALSAAGSSASSPPGGSIVGPSSSPATGGSIASTAAVASASPSASSPSPSAVNLIADGGFESGAGSPWQLIVAPGAEATVSADRTSALSGTASARVDIALDSAERAGVALCQHGLPVSAGETYTVSLLVRASETREVRVRLVSSGGATLGARVFTVGPTPMLLTASITSMFADLSAGIEIGLGRSTATTWIDDVAVYPKTP